MRALVRLLVLALLPVLLFTVSTPGAQAVDKYGDLHRAQIEVESDSLGYRYDNGVCGVAARYAVTKLAGPGTAGYAQQVAFGLDCEGEWNSVFDNDAPSGETIVTFRGTGCELSAVLTEKPKELEAGVTGKITEVRNFTAPANGCEVTRVCFDGEYTSNNPGPDTSTNVYGCADLTMGTVPLPSEDRGTCPKGMPTRLDFQDWDNTQWNGYHQHWLDIGFRDTPPVVGGAGWSVYYVTWPGTDVGARSNNHVTTLGSGSWTAAGYTYHPSGLTDVQSGDGSGHIKGVHLVFSGVNGGGVSVGLTDPNTCNFWFSDTKILDRPSDTMDDPYATLNTDVPASTGAGDPDTTPEEPPASGDCNFSPTQPSTWLEGGMCAVVGLLKGIWDTLGDILGALGNIVTGIVDGILGGLAALFIPSDGFFDAKVQQLRDDVDASSPGKWFGAVSSWAPSGSVGGCAGPTVNVDIMSEHESFQPLNACGGTMATVAALCKAVLSVALVFFGGIACLRGLGAGFGWSPAIGRGGGDA